MSIYILDLKAYTCYYCLYAPNLEEVEGAYWFGPVFHTHGQGGLEVRDKILIFDMWSMNMK